MRSLLALLIMISLLAAGYFYAAPISALSGLAAALETGDPEDIEDRVDFPVLRQHVREQLSAKLLGDVGDQAADNPFAVVAAGVTTLVLDKLLASTVTPAGFSSLIKGQHPRAGDAPSRRPSPEPDQDLFENARIERHSFDRFSVWVPNDHDDREVRVVFRRYGIGWKVTNVLLP